MYFFEENFQAHPNRRKSGNNKNQNRKTLRVIRCLIQIKRKYHGKISKETHPSFFRIRQKEKFSFNVAQYRLQMIPHRNFVEIIYSKRELQQI